MKKQDDNPAWYFAFGVVLVVFAFLVSASGCGANVTEANGDLPRGYEYVRMPDGMLCIEYNSGYKRALTCDWARISDLEVIE